MPENTVMPVTERTSAPAPCDSSNGTVPLVLASGAGAEVRSVTGITVFAGMLGVTLFGLFLTPVFYVALRTLVTRRAAAGTSAIAHGSAAA